MTDQIWRKFNGRLLSFIKARVNDEEIAKDILQDVFVKVHQNLDTLKSEDRIESWIYQITRNVIIDYYRRKKLDTTTISSEDLMPEKVDLKNQDFTNCMLPFIDQLPEKDRDIIKQVSFQNLSQKEYAEKHNLSYTAAKSRIQRAREKLKRLFMTCCAVESDKYGNLSLPDGKNCDC